MPSNAPRGAGLLPRCLATRPPPAARRSEGAPRPPAPLPSDARRSPPIGRAPPRGTPGVVVPVAARCHGDGAVRPGGPAGPAASPGTRGGHSSGSAPAFIGGGSVGGKAAVESSLGSQQGLHQRLGLLQLCGEKERGRWGCGVRQGPCPQPPPAAPRAYLPAAPGTCPRTRPQGRPPLWCHPAGGAAGAPGARPRPAARWSSACSPPATTPSPAGSLQREGRVTASPRITQRSKSNPNASSRGRDPARPLSPAPKIVGQMHRGHQKLHSRRRLQALRLSCRELCFSS